MFTLIPKASFSVMVVELTLTKLKTALKILGTTLVEVMRSADCVMDVEMGLTGLKIALTSGTYRASSAIKDLEIIRAQTTLLKIKIR